MTKKRRQKLTTDSVAESGTIIKNWQGRKTIALVYPNIYPVGMSNLGFQTVYHLLNGYDEVVCERVFLPAAESGENGHPPVSVESARWLAEFDLIAFSISFENDYPNILNLLKQSGLPLIATRRDERFPLLIAGGVTCFINPEPLSPFFDGFIIGEAEESIPSLVKWLVEYGNKQIPRKDRLFALAHQVPGAYVPEFYQPEYHTDGTLAEFLPLEDVPSKIRVPHLSDLSTHSSRSTIITKHTTFENTVLIEVSRGCPHGCRFCSAGYIYRPPRFRDVAHIEKDLMVGKAQSDRVGLVGAAVSDLPEIEKLCSGSAAEGLQIGFSSLRADALSETLIDSLKKSGIKTATIAPDAGSQRLRNVINKGLTEKDILTAAERLVSHNIPNLKLYFMIGLPTETMADIDAIADLCKAVKLGFLNASRAKGKIGEITVSLSSFVPKPFTPFQWAAMDDVKQLKQKVKRIKKALGRVPNLKIYADMPRWSYIQALLSRGDRRVAQLLLSNHQNGGNWPQVIKNSSVDPLFYTQRKRCEEELFPWDFIDHGIDKSFLWKEFQRALSARQSAPCPADPTSCGRCGVCRPDPSRQK